MFLHILFRTLPESLFKIIAEIASFRITYHISDFGNIQLVLDKQLRGSFQPEVLHESDLVRLYVVSIVYGIHFR